MTIFQKALISFLVGIALTGCHGKDDEVGHCSICEPNHIISFKLRWEIPAANLDLLVRMPAETVSATFPTSINTNITHQGEISNGGGQEIVYARRYPRDGDYIAIVRDFGGSEIDVDYTLLITVDGVPYSYEGTIAKVDIKDPIYVHDDIYDIQYAARIDVDCRNEAEDADPDDKYKCVGITFKS